MLMLKTAGKMDITFLYWEWITLETRRIIQNKSWINPVNRKFKKEKLIRMDTVKIESSRKIIELGSLSLRVGTVVLVQAEACQPRKTRCRWRNQINNSSLGRSLETKMNKRERF